MIIKEAEFKGVKGGRNLRRKRYEKEDEQTSILSKYQNSDHLFHFSAKIYDLCFSIL